MTPSVKATADLAPNPPAATGDLGAFERELDRVRLRALRTYARIEGREPDAEALTTRLAAVGGADAAERVHDLSARLGLEPDDVGLLWAVVAASIDPVLALHLPSTGPRRGGVNATGLSLAQYTAMVELDHARARRLALRVAGAHPLRVHGLVEPRVGQPLGPDTGLVAPIRVASYLSGDDTPDPALEAFGGLVDRPESPVLDGPSEALVTRLRQLANGPVCSPVVLLGRRGVGRRALVRIAADRPVAFVDLERVPRDRHGLGDALAALGREVLLGGALPLIAGLDELSGPGDDVDDRRREVARFVDRCRGAVFLTATRTVPRIETRQTPVRIDVPLPSARMRAALWRRALGDAAEGIDQDVGAAALRFQLGPGGIGAAVGSARAAAAAQGVSISASHLAEGVRSTIEERLQGLARRHSTALTWDDVVLPSDTAEQIEQLVARIRHSYLVLEEWGIGRHLPGPGVAALFSGSPGTGKTLVASLVAKALDLDLYRVDLSQIVSKWIGETEKQLEEVFAAAESGHAVLLFDEADALFAKRTEVKGATERYANLEINFLLQRLESFAGIAILTTNMEGSLDPAFRRRLAAHVKFPHPEEDERRQLWRRMLPQGAPLARDIDVEELAEAFPAFAGAHIRNAITTAAFLAAAEGSPISQAVLRRGAREETQAMGRIVKVESTL